MIAYSGLIGLTVIYSTAGFTAGPVSTPSRSKGSCGRACASYQPVARHRAPQLDAGWRLPTKQQAVRSWPMRAAADGTGDTEPAAEAAPRLKRVRKRRKDASPIATAGEDEDGVEPSSPAGEQAAAAAAVDFESARAEAAAAVMAVEEPEPEAVVMPVAAQKVEQAVEGAPRSAGDTRGTKVRVDNSDDYISEQLADAASAASGAAGSAASAVSGAAKSAMNAAMSAIGQGGGEDMADNFDIDNIPAPSANTRRRTTPGKSAAELADLGADIERFRKIENRQPMGAGESFALGAKDLISTIITVDFFVVIVFMLWFIAGIVSSYGFSNTFLLDQFNDKWTPVVQPALGVLMGGTIAGGVVSKLGESGDDEEKR